MYKQNNNKYHIEVNETKIFDDEDLNELYDYIDKRIYQDKSSEDKYTMYAFTIDILVTKNMLTFQVEVCMVEDGYGTEFYPLLVHIDNVDNVYRQNKIIYHKKDYSDLITRKKIKNGYMYIRKLTNIHKKYANCLDKRALETSVIIEIYTKNKEIRDLILKHFKHYAAFV